MTEVNLPSVKSPTELVAAPVIRGAQRPVAAEDYVMVKYRMYSWKTGEMVEDKYIGLALAISISLAIGTSFILTKKVSSPCMHALQTHV